MALRERYEIPGKMRTWSLGLIAVGVLALILGFIFIAGNEEHHGREVFWGTLMYNSLFFLLVTNAAMFFICATTLAMGGWQMVFRRVSEAISTLVPVFGIIAFIILMVAVFGTHIYHWNSPEAASDPILKGKLGFLNPTFFIIWTTLAIGLWSLLGWRMRKLSTEADAGPMNYEAGQSYIWRNTVNASLFIVWFALTVGSTVPWLWMMSIDAHWYSTMYSWYTFASSFVAGMALIGIWVIYMKNKGYLEIVNEEHLHDIGKFMFAFSIFWCYLWFAQYMLIWYSNQPEETVYFWPRVKGPYKGIFFLNLIINFICPLLILMRRGSKRNYTLMTFMAVLILFGHWMDFYQMVIGSISPEHVTWGTNWWFDFGIMALFVGIMIFFVGRALVSKPLVAKYHPFLKESIIHHT
jgi:hypothetical protein